MPTTTLLSPQLSGCLKLLIAAAQKCYDEWDASDPEYGDDEVGFGGICHLIADAFCEVLSDAGLECRTVSASCGEQHVWAIVLDGDVVWNVDIWPFRYERGGGYQWTKIPGVVFDESDLEINVWSGDPEEFHSLQD